MLAEIELPPLEEIEREIDRRACRGSLAEFVKRAWHVLEPATEYVHGWHIDALCWHLEQVTNGEITRLLINVPPGTSKSLIVSVFWPAWEWGPQGLRSMRYLSTAHNEKNVTRDTRRMRDLVLSDWYQARWPEVKLRRIAETSFDNTDTGGREGSPFSSLTGNRAGRLIIDDPHSVEGSLSDADRERAVRMFKTTAVNRLNDQTTSAIVVIMQRLHEEDVSGVILSEGMDYVHLCLPLEYEPARGIENAVGFKDPRTEPGEVLDPIRFPPAAVKELKLSMRHQFAGQYQQRPTAQEGEILKRDWWMVWDDDRREFEGVEPKKYPKMEYKLASLDTAYTKDQEKDASALTIWGVWIDQKRRRRAMLMYAWSDRLEFPELARKVAKTCKDWGVNKLLIEAKASGLSVAQELRRFHSDHTWSVQTVNPGRLDKVARAHVVAPLFEAGMDDPDNPDGMIFAPDKSWADMVIDQCASFPRGKHDDLVDSVTQALSFLRDNGLLNMPFEKADPVDELPQFGPAKAYERYYG